MRQIAILLAVGLALSACASVQHTREQVNTVNQAVSILQVVDDRNAWQQVNDAIDDLSAARSAYAAIASLDAAGTSLTWRWQVDEDGDQQLDISAGEGAAPYLLPAQSATVYRMDAAGDLCLVDNATAASLRAGLQGLLVLGDFQAASTQALAVSVAPQDTVVAGRDATRYELRSRLPDAADLLAAYQDEHAPQALAAAENLSFSGSMARDDETGALLELTISVTDRAKGVQTSLHFAVTQWGAQPDVPHPDLAVTVPACD